MDSGNPRARGGAEPPALDRLPVTALRGVGPRVAERLQRLAIRTVQDLLFHLPLRYEDRTRVVPLGSLRPGDQAVVEGWVELAEVVLARKRMLLCRLSDGTGALTLRFFHFSPAQRAGLARGKRLRCYGEARAGRGGLEMVHPEYRQVEGEHPQAVDEHLTPVYPTTEGVHQLKLRDLAAQALDWLSRGAGLLTDWLPRAMLDEAGLLPLEEALRAVHRPAPDTRTVDLERGTHPAIRRLAFEELLAHRLSLRQLRARVRRSPAPVLAPPGRLQEAFLASLPFALTDAQRRVGAEIRHDLGRPHPMLRLVQGDVGSGKTVVAAAAALTAMEAGYQTALMAPTELLAEQHYHSFRNWLAPLDVDVAWLSGRLKGKGRGQVLEAIGAGDAAMVVGTHALFQEGVRFARLGLVVVDEQHRFGVHQRLALREKGSGGGHSPHQLIMTATPIPRTLAMTAYADLDVSVIDELPPGRRPVATVVVPDSRRAEVVERVARACRDGRQAYWVCTLIEESDTLQARAAADTAAALGEALPGLRVGLVHGRMKSTEKEQAMAAFKRGAIDLLVATTVIEVGVDVPNASLMIIENAERLGLAQLHQLRGRVGRGRAESTCVLMYQGRLSRAARDRLSVLRDTADGFAIAQRDLELRGPGEVLGTRQTGMLHLRVADVLRDQALFPGIQQAAEQILSEHPQRVAPLVQRWLGGSTQYGQV
ncbi:MAG: ATP-dependent DNA helicase RecG [Gammaproteobacteria bacterium]|nr:ATP-dependent DNA helicase RecG [Gammaproteobacteria bacterium]NIR97152.1 ATP-dependent DNA helicase RecG [Gammaproteobacteria bacterium]NIT62850.1 ATP-dependent DNA helicase RecG [Gammaproteobacteria bacterium]NIV19814.1 ATP-dependent DNA helicase RecG [Gammaproteobacteria bacterium]NIX11347.1 ATP-dependent DNA helicase RecG [Gammaproteobacteria bacterium]